MRMGNLLLILNGIVIIRRRHHHNRLLYGPVIIVDLRGLIDRMLAWLPLRDI